MTNYSPLWRLWEGVQGDPAIYNNWGTPNSANFGLLETGAVGTVSVSLAGLTTYSLTAVDGAPDQSRPLAQIYTGALTANCTVTIPAAQRVGWAINSTTGGFSVILTTGSGTTATIPTGGSWAFWYCDGTNVSVLSVYHASISTGAIVANSVTYNSTEGHAIAFGWNGTNLIGHVDGTGSPGALATVAYVSGNYATTSYVNGTFATISYVNGTFATNANLETNYAPYSWVEANYYTTSTSDGRYLINGSNGSLNYLNLSGSVSGPFGGGWIYFSSGNGPQSPETVNVSVGGPNAFIGSAFFAQSDEIMKDEIRDITDVEAINYVRMSRPRMYRKYASPRGQRGVDDLGVTEAGFIAQEQIEAGFEHLVGSMSRGGIPERHYSSGLIVKQDNLLHMDRTNAVALLLAHNKSLEDRLTAIEKVLAEKGA